MMLLALSVKALAQENNIVVKGVVTDTNKEPMIGVNVLVKGTTKQSILKKRVETAFLANSFRFIRCVFIVIKMFF